DLSATHRLRGDASDEVWRQRFEQNLRNNTVRQNETDYGVAQCVRAGIEWLERQRRRDRLFLWLDCFDPHEPWDPPAPFDALYDPGYQGVALVDPVPGPVEGYLSERELRHVKALYAGEVTFVDRWVGVFLDAVRRLGLMENTLVVLTSDHGEPLGEHGYIRKCRPENWEELVHIPLLIRHPDGLGAGQRFGAFVQTCDLMPTLLHVLGIEGVVESPVHRNAPPMHGRSLLPLMSGKADRVREYAYIGHYRQSWNIRSAEWSYHLWLNGNRAPSLFCRATDPGEQRDVLAENQGIGDALELALRRFVAGLA
ncbi:MAG: sulfatase, partial [Armatimonadota bacterium]|nr:sulfatase [Armatimonadota bacterium]